MWADHLKLLLQDIPAQELLAYAATLLARAQVPEEAASAVAMARLTALAKPDGGVRGIATGDTFRRLGLRRPTCKVGFSRCKARARDAWHQAVCISKTQPCMSDQDSIIQRKFLPVSLLLIGFPPRAQQFASRKPTCAGPTQILLFYYFTILLFYYFTILLFYYFTILLFYYFTILLFYYFTILLFTILLFYYFTILLFYYFTNFTNFTNFTGNREFASRKPNLACRTRILLSRENFSLSLYF